MKKKFFTAIAVFCILCLSLCACNKQEETPPAPPLVLTRTLTFPTGENIGAAIANLEANAVKNDGYDYDEETPMSDTAVYVRLADNATTVTDGNGDPYPDGYADVSGNIIHIQKAGTYVFTGSLSDGQIVVSTEDRAQLIFRNVTLHCSDRPAIEIYGSGKKVLTMADGTDNNLSDGNERADVTKDGVIRAAHAVTINGKGSLTITAKFGSAVRADAVKVIGCAFTVSEARTDALRCGAFLYISGATANIRANGFSLWAADETIVNSSRLDLVGGVYGRDVFFDGSTLNQVSSLDGVVATRLISAQTTTLRIKTAGDGLSAEGEDPNETDGIVRLFRCDAVLADGDDGVRARFFTVSGGTLLCYGEGAQICITDGAECSLPAKEAYFADAPIAGKTLKVGKTTTTLVRDCRTLAYVGAISDGEKVLVDDEEYAALR